MWTISTLDKRVLILHNSVTRHLQKYHFYSLSWLAPPTAARSKG